MKFSEAMSSFLDHVKLSKSEGTFNHYRQYLNYHLEYFGESDVEGIDRRTYLKYLTAVKDKSPLMSNATLNKHITVFKVLYKFTTDKDFPYAKLKENRAVINTVPADVVNKIFRHYETKLSYNYQFRNYVFYRLLYDTGLRLNEMINIRVRNIDFELNVILVQITKSDVDRYVVFTRETSLLLKKFIAAHHRGEYLFYNFETGHKLTVTSVETMTVRLKKRLNIKCSISPHKWRHTFATRFVRGNGNMESLRLMLGHSNLKTTQKYLHLDKNDLVEAYNNVLGFGR